MMDLRTASGAGDAGTKLSGVPSPSSAAKLTLDSPENGKTNNKNSSVKSFNIDGLIGDQNTSDEPQNKRRRTSTSTTDSNASRHSEEDEDIGPPGPIGSTSSMVSYSEMHDEEVNS